VKKEGDLPVENQHVFIYS